MNEITKLYENAGVKADRIVCYRGFDNCIDNDFNCHCHNEKPCKDAIKKYPPFTAKKQIEMVKFMLRRGVYYDTDGDTYWFHYTGEIENAKYEAFEQAVAQFINELWEYLTEKQKQEIKEILE